LRTSVKPPPETSLSPPDLLFTRSACIQPPYSSTCFVIEHRQFGPPFSSCKSIGARPPPPFYFSAAHPPQMNPRLPRHVLTSPAPIRDRTLLRARHPFFFYAVQLRNFLCFHINSLIPNPLTGKYLFLNFLGDRSNFSLPSLFFHVVAPRPLDSFSVVQGRHISNCVPVSISIPSCSFTSSLSPLRSDGAPNLSVPARSSPLTFLFWGPCILIFFDSSTLFFPPRSTHGLDLP